MVDQLAVLASRFPIVSIEDDLAEDDWEGWRLQQGIEDELGGQALYAGAEVWGPQGKA